MRVVISVGGSILAPGQGPTQLAAYGSALTTLLEAGCELGVVVGGGATARRYIETGRSLGANEMELDSVGIAVTRLNARLLLAALPEDTQASPALNYEEAHDQLLSTDICVMGGTTPGHTTDAVSAALAEYLDAELLVYATSVPGVFDADPESDATASRFDRLDPAELVELVVELDNRAGSPAPIDLLGAKLIERSGMEAVVVDGSDPDRVVEAILEDVVEGTRITPDPDSRASRMDR